MLKRAFALLGLLFYVGAQTATAAEQDGASLFKDKCASCHTFGQGRKHLVCPDLKKVGNWDTEMLRKKVASMQKYAGKLSEDEINKLTTYVKEEATKVQSAKQKKGA